MISSDDPNSCSKRSPPIGPINFISLFFRFSDKSESCHRETAPCPIFGSIQRGKDNRQKTSKLIYQHLALSCQVVGFIKIRTEKGREREKVNELIFRAFLHHFTLSDENIRAKCENGLHFIPIFPAAKNESRKIPSWRKVSEMHNKASIFH